MVLKYLSAHAAELLCSGLAEGFSVRRSDAHLPDSALLPFFQDALSLKVVFQGEMTLAAMLTQVQTALREYRQHGPCLADLGLCRQGFIGRVILAAGQQTVILNLSIVRVAC